MRLTFNPSIPSSKPTKNQEKIKGASEKKENTDYPSHTTAKSIWFHFFWHTGVLKKLRIRHCQF